MTDQSDYLRNVWRLLFVCTPEEKGWEAMEDPAYYSRIFEWGIGIGRDLNADLSSAQAAVDAGKKYEDWIAQVKEAGREPASA